MVKAVKFKRALKSAARLPGRRGSGRHSYSPLTGEVPIVVLRIQVISCKDLLSKDKNGLTDSFVSLSILNTRFQTPVVKRTVQPMYSARDATFDFPLYLSLADRLGALEVVVWDKDMLKKVYLGEIALPVDDWFGSRAYGFYDPGNSPFFTPLVSSRQNKPACGSVQIKLGFMQVSSPLEVDFETAYNELVRRSRPSLVSAPPTEGVGTVRSRGGLEDILEDDGGISSDESDDSQDEDEYEEGAFTDALDSPLITTTPTPAMVFIDSTTPTTPMPGTPHVNVTPASPPSLPRRTSSAASAFLPRIKLPRRKSITPPSPSAPSTPGASSSSPEGSTPPVVSIPPREKKKVFRKSWGGNASSSNGRIPVAHRRKKRAEYSLGSGENDILGIVMLEIQSAEDLPRLKNMTRTGWDMDPFVVISFGKKVFRTRVIRHSRNPVWDEKLLFHVRRYETSFKVQLTVLDWDKLSSNDYVGEANFDVKELIDNAPQADEETGLYNEETNVHPMKEYKLSVKTSKEMPWEAKHNPKISFRAKYRPYDLLRQQFWHQYLKEYDTDDNGYLSHLEITAMLDSLGSTLTRATINSFFTRFDKIPLLDPLSFQEIIICLETELGRPDNEKRRVDNNDDSIPNTGISATPLLEVSDGHGMPLELGQLDFSGPAHIESATMSSPNLRTAYPTEPSQQPLVYSVAIPATSSATPSGEESDPMLSSSENDEDVYGSGSAPERIETVSTTQSNGNGKSMRPRFRRSKVKQTTSFSTITPSQNDAFERVINVRNCPLCHRPRLNAKAERDIITHLAVCASHDWNRVDRIVVGNFVTASQAQRKWYTKVLSKVSSGNYKIGANSANIIVQNRLTGQLEEEKMPVYLRLGIRLLYKGAKSRMEGGGARRLLKSLSIKQGLKYDDPASIRDIAPFIQFHQLNLNEILDPLSSFKTFNQFFYRKLKPEARPIEQPNDPCRLISAADCRLMAFATVNDATRLWIKGREFSVTRLLGDAYKHEAAKYNGGALAIFRLAPQDYHRFHSPVDGAIGPIKYISGEYYTVNPQAIRTTLDVFGENARKIVPIDSPQFGRVMTVCVGAMMVGSIVTTVDEGDSVKRGDELGYFAFGGSTLVMLFEPGVMEWDEDLVINGLASLETLVRVGMGIGSGRRKAAIME